MLSADGRCKTFDARADGYVRGEAAAALVLRGAAASQAGLALRGSAVRQDGRSASLTAPNGQAQRRCCGRRSATAASEPAALSAYEAHGTGTPLGDPIEVRSLAAAVLAARAPRRLSASGTHQGELRATPSRRRGWRGWLGGWRRGCSRRWRRQRAAAAHQPARRLCGRGRGVRAPTQLARGAGWRGGRGGRGGVSSFGYSGTIAHAVLEAAPAASAGPPPLPPLVYKRRSFPWYEAKGKGLPPSCRLAGSMRASSALRRLRRLPDAAALVQLQSLTLDASEELSEWLRARREPLVLLCRGPVGGAGALLLLDAATVVVADTTFTLSVQPEGSVRLQRRPAGIVTATTLSASDAAQAGLVDSALSPATAAAESRRLVQRLSSLPAPLLKTCRSLLPAPSVDAALVAMGSLLPHPPRSIGKRLVRLYVDGESKVAVVELNDPSRMNSFSAELAEDVAEAAASIGRDPLVKAIVLQGAGPHFSVGGNPFQREKAAAPLAAVALGCRAAFDGFGALYKLGVPMVAAVHGKLIGGGVAACLHADYIVADSKATFEHGNLVRGVCCSRHAVSDPSKRGGASTGALHLPHQRHARRRRSTRGAARK